MSARRFRPLRVADIPNLPEPCARCAFWETSLGDLVYPADHRDDSKVKLEWAETVTARWGYCGVLALNDGEPIGFLTMAPSALVPRRASRFEPLSRTCTGTSPRATSPSSRAG